MDGMTIRQERRYAKDKSRKATCEPVNVQVIPKKDIPKPGDKEFKPKKNPVLYQVMCGGAFWFECRMEHSRYRLRFIR